jgi:hypothetical protein
MAAAAASGPVTARLRHRDRATHRPSPPVSLVYESGTPVTTVIRLIGQILSAAVVLSLVLRSPHLHQSRGSFHPRPSSIPGSPLMTSASHPDAGDTPPGRHTRERIIVTAVWGLCSAVGVGLLTWSGAHYIPSPRYLGVVLAAGIVGAWLGELLASWRVLLHGWARALVLTGTPLLLALWLAGIGYGQDNALTPDYLASLDRYRGGCLAGTDYGSTEVQRLSLQADTITVVPRHGPPLRFTRTGYSWPSPGRAEIGDSGVEPTDQPTRAILTALGCR